MNNRWEYMGGEFGTTAIRTYRKGRIGRVVRTRMSRDGRPTSPGRVAYFVWADPDPEYASEEEAIRALGMGEGHE